MSLDPNYPRWMYHRSLDPVLIRSEEEETALGAEWSRTVVPAPPLEPAIAVAPKPRRGRPPLYRHPEARNVQRQ